MKKKDKNILWFNEIGKHDVAVVGGTSKPVEENFGENPHHSLRFGVDTEMFKPYPMKREDDRFNVGFVGNWLTPRRYMKDLFIPLKTLPGVRLMVFPTTWPTHTRPDEIESCGGDALLEAIVEGDKWYPGLPSMYNKMDIYIRCDIDHGLQLSVFEAAACGVPIVATDSGPTKELTDAGGGILIDVADRDLKRIARDIRKAVVYLQEHPKERKAMGKAGRKFVETKWQWSRFIPAWRKFFREGVKNAKKV